MFCKNCGAQVDDSTNVCGSCGAPVEKANNPILNTEDFAASFDPTDIQENKLMATLSYIIFFLPLVASPNSRFGRFHSNQGLLVLLVSLAWGIVGSILAFIPFLGWLISLAGWFAIWAVIIMAMINTNKGMAKQLPFIGQISIIK